jgi:hypothetical protein
MDAYFLDTSATIKYYFSEIGPSFVANLYSRAKGRDIFILVKFACAEGLTVDNPEYHP